LSMIYYTLITDKVPYSETTNWAELKAAVKKGPPELPEKMSKSFKFLITEFWQKKAIVLSTQQEKQEAFWNQIFQEVSLLSEEKAKAVWDTAVKDNEVSPDGAKSIIWDKFSPTFWKMVLDTGKDTPIQNSCVRYLLRVNDQSGELTFDNFSAFARVFSPFCTGTTEGKAYIADIVSLCSEKWFYGLKTRSDAEAMLNSPIAKGLLKNKKIPFLIRLSQDQGFKFCVSHYKDMDGKEIIHNILSPEMYTTTGFLPYIRTEITKNSKFGALDIPGDNPFTDLKNAQKLKLKGGGPNKANVSSIMNSTTGKFVN